MERSMISSCHSLRVIPISRVIRFAEIDCQVYMQLRVDADDELEIPGTIAISATTDDDGTMTEQIAFECSGVSVAATQRLERYKAAYVIATYVDETGNERVAGSPTWPLRLDYTIDGGAYNVMLKGKGLKPDAFVMK